MNKEVNKICPPRSINGNAETLHKELSARLTWRVSMALSSNGGYCRNKVGDGAGENASYP